MPFDKSKPDLENEASKVDLPGLVTLGGCVVSHLGNQLNLRAIRHHRHLWRRPTIALMSDPVSRFRLDIEKLPPAYANYFLNDAASSHQAELNNQNPANENVFLFDITRDMFTGVVELEPDCWIMDPTQAISIVEGLTHENMSPQILDELCRGPVRRVSPLDDWETFFPLWQKAFRKFADRVTSQYERVMIARIFTTDLRYDSSTPFYKSHVAPTNARLEEMYPWIEANFDFEWVTVPRDRAITGKTGVPYGGPTATHFLAETHSLFAHDFLRVLKSRRGDNVASLDPYTLLIEQAFDRARQHEEALEDIKRLEGQIEELENQLALTRTTADRTREEATAAHEAARVAGHDRDQALARIDALQARIAAQDAVLSSPVAALRRSIARYRRTMRQSGTQQG